MGTSISISELSAENGVPVVNTYGSIIGDNEDHADDSTTEVLFIFVRHHDRNISSSVWSGSFCFYYYFTLASVSLSDV